MEGGAKGGGEKNPHQIRSRIVSTGPSLNYYTRFNIFDYLILYGEPERNERRPNELTEEPINYGCEEHAIMTHLNGLRSVIRL